MTKSQHVVDAYGLSSLQLTILAIGKVVHQITNVILPILNSIEFTIIINVFF